MVRRTEKTDAAWRQELTDETYRVTRKGATERAFSGRYWDTKTQGIYVCACCGLPLFSSDTKFDSGTGWPSFYAPLKHEHITTKKDWRLLMPRIEVLCAGCDAHLGHVFSDGIKATGLRYCLNSAALVLEESV